MLPNAICSSINLFMVFDDSFLNIKTGIPIFLETSENPANLIEHIKFIVNCLRFIKLICQNITRPNQSTLGRTFDLNKLCKN